MTTRSSLMAASTSRSRPRSIRRKLTRGLACTSCHAIVHVDSTMGNNGFTIEYPPLHQLMTSKNKVIRSMVDFMTYLNPEPHRETFHEAVHDSSSLPNSARRATKFTSMFRSTIIAGSAASTITITGRLQGFGEGARSFYYPPEGKTCVGLPHAAGTFGGSGQSRAARSTRTVSRRRIPRSPTRIKMPSR